MLLIILIFSVFLSCSEMVRTEILSSHSIEELESDARDRGENKPLRASGIRSGGSSSGSSGGSGGGGGSAYGFCSDCDALVNCLNDVSNVNLENLKNGWYYFCPAESDYCGSFLGWASYKLSESEYRKYLGVNSTTASTLTGCSQQASQEYQSRNQQCSTTHSGDQTAIDTCIENSEKAFYIAHYKCSSSFYNTQSDFFCP